MTEHTQNQQQEVNSSDKILKCEYFLIYHENIF